MSSRRALAPAVAVALAAAALAGLAASCTGDNPYAGKKADPATTQAQATPPKLVGIDPARWECEALLTPKDLATVIPGGESWGELYFEPAEGSPGEGLPRPCTYVQPYKMSEEERKAEEKEQERRIKRAERNEGEGSFEDANAAWGKNRDRAIGVALDCRDSAHGRTTDWIASLAARGTPMSEVTVGKKGVEHSNAQLVFIDDKTPCSVTITGHDAQTRAAVARLVHGRLKPENAPMRPRAAR